MLLGCLVVLLAGCKKRHKGAGALEEITLNDGNWDRTGLVYLPSSYNNGSDKLPLILALHGRLGDGKGTVKFMKLNPKADALGYVVVYPDGISRSWADARNSGPAHDRGVDDITFLSKLIDECAAKYRIDTSRVYMVGMSNGGFMTTTFCCAKPEKIAAAVTVTGIMAVDPSTWCTPSSGTPVMFLMGTEDPLVPYEGGEIAAKNGKGNGSFTCSVDEAVVAWRNNNGCSDAKQVIDYPDLKRDQCTMRETRYTDCSGNNEVVLIDCVGGGHTWPGGDQYLSKRRIGRVCRELRAENIIFEFFEKHQ